MFVEHNCDTHCKTLARGTVRSTIMFYEHYTIHILKLFGIFWAILGDLAILAILAILAKGRFYKYFSFKILIFT